MGVVRNWARNQACVPGSIERPRSTDEVAAIVRRARAEGRRVKAIGSGHSFTGLAMTGGVLVSIEHLDTVRGVRGCDVTVGAGVTLGDLSDALAGLGLAMPNLGDIDVQSIAGAISTATHGTGLAFGNLATTVVGMTLVDGCGVVRRVDEGSELLRVAAVGLGALGIVTEVTLRCIPAFNLRAVETVEALDDLLGDVAPDGVPRFASSADHAEFFWMPGARRCQVKRNHRTDDPVDPPSRWEYVRDKYLAENLAFGAVCRIGRRFPSLAPRIARLVSSSVGERTLIDRSDRVFASPRHVRFVEMEYGIPVEALPEAVDRVRRLTTTLSFPALFPIEVRVSAGDDIALSTAHRRTTGWVAVHQYRGAPYEHYFRGVEAIMDDYDGRPHWGKLHFQSAETLGDRYPDWDVFQETRADLDPNGVFSNEEVDRVLGPVSVRPGATDHDPRAARH